MERAAKYLLSCILLAALPLGCSPRSNEVEIANTATSISLSRMSVDQSKEAYRAFEERLVDLGFIVTTNTGDAAHLERTSTLQNMLFEKVAADELKSVSVSRFAKGEFLIETRFSILPGNAGTQISYHLVSKGDREEFALGRVKWEIDKELEELGIL